MLIENILIFILIAKSFFLLTPHPTLSHKGRGELEEKTFGKRYNFPKDNPYEYS